MNRGFPIRINKNQAYRHFHKKPFFKKPESDVKIFNRGARHYLHPSLAILDRVDCELTYYKKDKIIVVSYDPVEENINDTDYIKKVYNKCVMSGDVDFIVNIIREYMNDKRNYHRDNIVAINSDVNSDPIDITMEDFPV